MNDKIFLYGLWILKFAVAMAFLAAGFAKISGAEMMVTVFDDVGVGQWFRYVTGAIEIVGALTLFVPGKAVIGASALAITMIGAVFAHLVLIGGSPVPALVLLAVSGGIAYFSKAQLRQFA